MKSKLKNTLLILSCSLFFVVVFTSFILFWINIQKNFYKDRKEVNQWALELVLDDFWSIREQEKEQNVPYFYEIKKLYVSNIKEKEDVKYAYFEISVTLDYIDFEKYLVSIQYKLDYSYYRNLYDMFGGKIDTKKFISQNEIVSIDYNEI